MDKVRVVEIVKFIVELLQKGDYKRVVEVDYKKILNADEIKTVLEEYGGRITIPPDASYEKIDFYWNDDKNHVSIDYNLWIDDKESDLTLIADIKKENDEYLYSIEDIHVL